MGKAYNGIANGINEIGALLKIFMRKKTTRKREKIKALLEAGYSTRTIATKVHVSLRDVGKVRGESVIAIRTMKHENETREKLSALDISYQQRQQQSQDLDEQIKSQLKEKESLDQEVERKKHEVLHVKQPVEPIYLPTNLSEVGKYMESLKREQLLAISKMAFNRYLKRVQDDYNKAWHGQFRAEE